jgi:hypothetical protein
MCGPAIPLLDTSSVTLALGVPSKTVKELIADVKAAHVVPGWIRVVDVV